jgi:hypothetical protein
MRNRSLEINVLRINGSVYPVELYERVPEAPLGGEPLGRVNLHSDTCSWLGKHLHLLWLNADGELRITTVPDEERWQGLTQIFVGV